MRSRYLKHFADQSSSWKDSSLLRHNLNYLPYTFTNKVVNIFRFKRVEVGSERHGVSSNI